VYYINLNPDSFSNLNFDLYNKTDQRKKLKIKIQTNYFFLSVYSLSFQDSIHEPNIETNIQKASLGLFLYSLYKVRFGNGVKLRPPTPGLEMEVMNSVTLQCEEYLSVTGITA
jgi:hypothetical protein